MQRLYLHQMLAKDFRISADRSQFNYLVNVLRLKDGNQILVFNGKDGEWLATIEIVSRRVCYLILVEQTRKQTELPDLQYYFAPLKQGRLDYMVQKAVEMGVGQLIPVQTQHTQISRLNVERLEANVREACEQCGVLAVPKVRDMVQLKRMINSWKILEPERVLLFCDESDTNHSTMDVLTELKHKPIAILIGPEGGFSHDEQRILKSQSFVKSLPLGPRIMRADTAAVAALAVVQSVLGDWK